MPRAVSEWVGKTDDTKAPPRVRQRVYDRAQGVCHICALPIKIGETWDADHVIALINGGENRETNLAPAHKHCHVGKTAKDAAEKAKVASTRQKHIGVTRPAGKLQSPGFAKSQKPKHERVSLPPKQIYGRMT